MLCRQCGSDDHFIRDCDKAQKAALVNMVLDGSLPIGKDPDDLSVNEILDIFQDQPDDI